MSVAEKVFSQMMSRRSDHVIWDCRERPALHLEPEQQMVFRCPHCGERFVLALPCSITMAGIVAKQYGKEHRHCKKAPGPPNVSPERPTSPRASSEGSEASSETEGNIEGRGDGEM